MTFLRVLLFVGVGILPEVIRADTAPSTVETRLREALRDSRVQLTTVQDQVNNLQTAKEQADKDNADLKAKIDALNAQIATLGKQNADDKATADKAIADLNEKVADQAAQIAHLTQELADATKAGDLAKQLAADKEAARAKLALQAALLQRLVDDRETKNLELYKTGSEILVRYEKYSLGDVLDAKEPYSGNMRAKLESLVQDYKSRLLNQTIDFGRTGNAAATSPAQTKTQAKAPSTSPAGT